MLIVELPEDKKMASISTLHSYYFIHSPMSGRPKMRPSMDLFKDHCLYRTHSKVVQLVRYRKVEKN
jgi:hypothetical protein